jgi:hypothetical protein
MYGPALQEFRKSEKFSDVTVKVRKQTFQLHRMVLVSKSQYFLKRFESATGHFSTFDLDKLPGGDSCMELVADFCYDFPISHKLTVWNICHMVCASKFLEINSLEKECFNTLALLADKSLSNCCNILQTCSEVEKFPGESAVIDCCVQKLLRNWMGPTAILRKKFNERNSRSEIVQPWVSKLCHVPLSLIANIIEIQSSQYRSVIKDDEMLQLPLDLTDQLLILRTSENSMSPSEFLLLYRSSFSIQRTSYDTVFQALEMLLERNTSTPITDEIIQKVDFTKLSLHALRRAEKNPCIPDDVVLKATLSMCDELQKSTDIIRKQLKESEEEREVMQREMNNWKTKYQTVQRQLENFKVARFQNIFFGSNSRLQ